MATLQLTQAIPAAAGLAVIVAVSSLAQSQPSTEGEVPATNDLRETIRPHVFERNPFHDNAKMVPASFAETVRLRARGMVRRDSFDRLGFSAHDADVLREVARIDSGVIQSGAVDASAHLLIEMCSLPEVAVLKRGLLFAELDKTVSAALPAAIAEKLTELTPEGAAVLA